jgi:hypothetical protein
MKQNMLSVPLRFSDGLFLTAPIDSVSKMVVYEDEDGAREDALKLLEKMVKDNGRSVFGFCHGFC